MAVWMIKRCNALIVAHLYTWLMTSYLLCHSISGALWMLIIYITAYTCQMTVAFNTSTHIFLSVWNFPLHVILYHTKLRGRKSWEMYVSWEIFLLKCNSKKYLKENKSLLYCCFCCYTNVVPTYIYRLH